MNAHWRVSTPDEIAVWVAARRAVLAELRVADVERQAA